MRARKRADRRLDSRPPGAEQPVAAALPDAAELSMLHSGILPALDYWLLAVEACYHASRGQKVIDMEAASKAQNELERIEKQIEQLQDVSRDNPDTQKQLQELQGRVEAVKRRMAGDL